MNLIVRNLSFGYEMNQLILNRVTLSFNQNEIVGIMAPSGYGKSTLAKILCGLLPVYSGSVKMCDEKGKEQSLYQQTSIFPVQLIFQHPEQAINPRWKMKQVLDETGEKITDEIKKNLGIKEKWLERYPNELSGGELQSFAIARALMAKPAFIVADEISTMLDAVKQAQIWRFMIHQCQKEKIGMLVMSHNEFLLNRICTRTIDLTKMNK